ncbi:MAG: hypothetical protein FJ358_01625 [Thaumarchaeota archaeon]|nr:hypothetical protein [Nitrososphaerota archaeon]
MPFYECSEHHFIENLRRILESHVKIVVNRSLIQHDDGKYGLSFIPDFEIKKYETIAQRARVRSGAYAAKPFYDNYHKKFHMEGDVLHAGRYHSVKSLSIPYYRVEYAFSIWNDTYTHSFEVLFTPEIKLEKRDLPNHKKNVLMHTLNFLPPDEKSIKLSLPKSVLVFDVKRMTRA